MPPQVSTFVSPEGGLTQGQGGGWTGGPAVSPRNPARPRINMEFANLTYTVRRGCKTILHGVSGQFRAGELSAIMGPSGAGKSSLMDILVGYRSAGVNGDFLINDRPRDMRRFHKQSCYLPQEELLQPSLTVNEAMEVAVSLKLPLTLTQQKKDELVDETLSRLGLTGCRETRTDRLSGGQRKRLSIALELLSNPPILFLDEPTTGLDVVSTTQLVQLLRSLAADEGRTVICTLHQPSASLLTYFNHLYFLAEGRCVFQGEPDQLVPFLTTVNRPCAEYNNPADHILDLAVGEREYVALMSGAVQNGKLSLREEGHNPGAVLVETGCSVEAGKWTDDFPIPAMHQFKVLYRRMMLQIWRNKASLQLQFWHHVVGIVLLGCMFLKAGQDAAMAYNNLKFCMCIMVFFMYTQIMTPLLLFPSEVKLLKREYFNRWYGLKPYFLAVTLSRLPIIILPSCMLLTACYFITDQPPELVRFANFAAFCLLTALASESLGLAIGSICSVTNGSVVGPTVSVPMIMLAVYGLGFGDQIGTPMKLLMSTSFMRFGLHGLALTLYGPGRAPLPCSELYCHYRRPTVMLQQLGMHESTVSFQLFGMVFYYLLFRGIAFLALRYRLTAEFNNSILKLSAKLLKKS